MKKFTKLFSILSLVLGLTLITSCDLSSLSSIIGGFDKEEDEYSQVEQLTDIYRLAVQQGYTGTYEDWLNELKGDQIEIRSYGGYVQWRYSNSETWTNLMPLSELMGDNGLTPYIGPNGNWWIGNDDTGVLAEGQAKPGEDGKDGAPGKSAYEYFLELHPEYTGSEEQWLDDLLNGRLSEENYKYYTVTFDDGNGNVSELEILSKCPVDKPKNPIKIGYIFTGWYADGVKWNFDANVVLKDLKLEAGWIKSNITPTLNISYTYADKTNIYFDIYKDDITTIEAIALYKNGELVQTLDNLNERQFSNLLSNTWYRLEVTYSYDMNDGFGKQYTTISTDLWTSYKNSPNVYISNVNTTYNSIDVDLYINDYDNVFKFKYAELYKDGKAVARLESLDDLVFEGLLSNTYYTGRIYYEYDYNDGNNYYGDSYFEFNAHTNTLNKPVVTLNNIHSTQNTINAEVFISDPNDIDELVSISLYKGQKLIYTGTSLELAYKNLTDNTEYTIVVEHKYDVNDGNGLIIAKDEFVVKTHPVYSLLNTKVLNTSAILEGELVYIHAQVDNPSDAVFTKIFINGKEYSVDPASTSKNVFAYISSVEVGETEFTVDKLIAELDGIEFEYYTQDNNYAVAKVYKKLDVEAVEFVNSKYEVVDCVFNSETVYIKLTLDNPEGYSLDNINIDGYWFDLNSGLTKYDDETYYVKWLNGNTGWNERTLSSFTYSNEFITKQATCTIRTNRLMRLSNDSIYEISTVDELRSINQDNYYSYYYYYKLANDIDLSGIEWTPIERIYGVFDGNGHSIKNMRVAKTFTNTSVDIGLFKEGYAYICDTTLEEMIIMVELNHNDGMHYYGYIGGFVSRPSNGFVLDNCHIDKNSSISINGNINNVYVGGLFGDSYEYSTIKNSSNSANISVKGTISSENIGAFTGGYCKAYNSYNTGNVNKRNDQYIGLGNPWNENLFFNCYNTGALNGVYGARLSEDRYVINSISLGGKYANKTLDWTDKTYSFDSNGGTEVKEINSKLLTSLPMPEKEGYYFFGWYDNEELLGEAIKTPYYTDGDVKLYAKWIKKIDDISTLIENDSNYPWVEQDGIISSTNTGNIGWSDSYYKINANQDIRVFFTYYTTNNGNWNGDYYCYAYKYNDEGYLYEERVYTDEKNKYVDLKAGESLVFRAYNYGNSDVVMNIKDLVICSID